MVIGEARPKNVNDKILAKEVVLEKAPDGKELIKITVKLKCPGGKRVLLPLQVDLLSRTDRSASRPTKNFQAQMLGSGYLEAKCAKDLRKSCCSETDLLVSF